MRMMCKRLGPHLSRDVMEAHDLEWHAGHYVPIVREPVALLQACKHTS